MGSGLAAGERSARVALQVYCSPSAREWILRRVELAFEAKAPGVDLICHVAEDRACVDHVLAGSGDLALIGGELSKREQREHRLRGTVIGHHIVVPIVHASNPVRALPFATWAGINAGHHGSWHSLGGEAAPIQTVCRPPMNSGGDAAELKLRFDGPALATAVHLHSDREVIAFVANNPTSIGLVDLRSAQGERGIAIVEVDHVKPAKEQLVRGAWRLGTSFCAVEPPLPRPDARAFVEYLTSNAGRLILRRHLILP